MLHIKIALIAGLLIAVAGHHVAGLAVHRARALREREEARDSVRVHVDGLLRRRRGVLALRRVPAAWQFFASFTNDILTFMPRVEPAF